MVELSLTPQQLGGGFELQLGRLEPFDPRSLDAFCARAAAIADVAPRPNQVRLRVGEALYSYDVHCTLVREFQIEFLKTAERITVQFSNASSEKDLEIIGGILRRFLDEFAIPAGAHYVALQLFAHSRARDSITRDEYFRSLKSFESEAITHFGFSVRLKPLKGWPQVIKLSSEPSLILTDDGVFTLWETICTLPVKEPDRQLFVPTPLDNLLPALQEAAATCGLRFSF